MTKRIIKSLICVILFATLCTLTIAHAWNHATVSADDSVVEKITGKTYYTAPDGLKTNSGATAAEPLDIYTAMLGLKAGDTLYMAPGRYICDVRMTLVESGNAFSKISVIASSTTEKTIFDFSNMIFDSTNRGIQINADYWYFYGIDVTGAGDNGMYIAGDYNYIEMCEFYNNRDSGLQLGRGSSNDTVVSAWPSYNVIKNCTAYGNYDDETYGENADGFAAKLTVGYGNVFDGCIAYRNCDDGWDLYAKSDTGNVGTVIIKNCVAFENGWRLDGSTTRDGDGIGFKLGGSNMEGDVIISNCMAWGNRLHGFSDNSNPKTIVISNCTAYNNSVSVVEGLPGASDGGSVNFSLGKKDLSYNIYYGLLSYSTNQTATTVAYELGDSYLGSVGYSIFNTAKGVYKAVTDVIDGSSFDSSKAGTTFSGLTDSSFASVSFGYTPADYPSLHKLLRNSDGSINIGSMLDVTDNYLLSFCEGNQVGAKLNLTSWDAYDHYEFSTPTEGMTKDEIEVLAAYDTLEILCDKEAVYQNVALWTSLNECSITWTSSDSTLLEIGKTVYGSFSLVKYVNGIVYRSRYGDRNVTLEATIKQGEATKVKTFNLTLIQDEIVLGDILGVEETYIIDLYSRFSDPEVAVTNKTSYSALKLKAGVDYGVKKSYEYAETKTSEFNKVSKVYTTVPGIYRVTYQIQSYVDPSDTLTCSFNVFVVSPTSEIDFVNYQGYEFYVCQEGVHIIGNLTNVAGNMYVYLSENAIETVDSVIANGQKLAITSDEFDELVLRDNSARYYIHVVVANKAETYKSQVYTEEVSVVEISTCQAFYNLVNGSTSSVVIYLLINDLDFSDFTWNEIEHTNTFDGLLNGDGYTVSNITINGTTNKNCNIIYKVKGGTVMNINFDTIKLLGGTGTEGNEAQSQYVGIIGQMVGGFLHNVSMTNITATGYQSVGGLVAKICGGENYVSQISLINDYAFDENYNLLAGYPYFSVTTKYLGGIIGNIQRDTSELIDYVYVDDCYSDAYIGIGGDSGGYVGGIVGRIKNDLDAYTVVMRYCMFDGYVECSKNYVGGIIGGCESGAGYISCTYCVSRPVIIFGNTRSILDGVTLDQYGLVGFAVKTGSPIIGRYTTGTGTYIFHSNFATFADYNSAVGSSVGEEDLDSSDFYFVVALFDDDIWQYSEETKGIILIAPHHE